MNEVLQHWLDARISLPGMIACGVAAVNATGTCRSADANCPPETMEQILRLLFNPGPLPGSNPPVVRWHTWVFAHGKIRSVIRPDGWIFVAAVRTNSEAAQFLDPLAEEFLLLQPG